MTGLSGNRARDPVEGWIGMGHIQVTAGNVIAVLSHFRHIKSCIMPKVSTTRWRLPDA